MKVYQFLAYLPLALPLAAVARCDTAAAETAIAPLVRAINAVGPEGRNHRPAIDAWHQLSQADADQLPEILAGFQVDQPLASNWLRSIVETIAQRRLDAGGRLPAQELEEFVLDTSHAPRARRVAYELLAQIDPEIRLRLIPRFLNDPSLELRRDAVAYALGQAEALPATDRSLAAVAYRAVLSAARDRDQVDQAAEKLRALGETVDLPEHFGFITTWKLIAPFDHSDMRGSDVVYGPEVDPDPGAEYEGKEGPVRWVEFTTDDAYGAVDLNKALGRFKGAIAYAYAEFHTSQPRDVELRLGCINGNKVWLNGELLTANNVYHAGSYMDQYVGKGRLKAGKNVILLKIAQNEQTESWAQRWEFQLRVCDHLGTGVLSEDLR